MTGIQKFSFEGTAIDFDVSGEGIMINATEMGKVFGKQPKDFLRIDSTIAFIDELSRKENLPIGKIFNVTRGGLRQGTWMHRKLALKFAAWLDPKFELWVYDVIEKLMLLEKQRHQPQDLSRMQILQLAMEAEARRLELEAENGRLIEQNQRMARKAEYTDNVLASETGHSTTIIAKELDMTAIQLNTMLQSMNILYKTPKHEWVLTARYHGLGLTLSRTVKYTDKAGLIRTKIYFVWTEKGRAFILSKLDKRMHKLAAATSRAQSN